MQIAASYPAQRSHTEVEGDQFYLCGCLAAARTEAISETTVHTSWTGRRTIPFYTNLACGAGNFQLMGDYFFPSPPLF